MGPGQVPILMILFREEGINQKTISERIRIHETTIARTIRRLVDEGYLVRERDEHDSRAYKITITDKTKKIMDNLFRVENEFESKIFKEFSEEERMEFMRLLRKMSTNAQEMTGEVEMIKGFPPHPIMRSKRE